MATINASNRYLVKSTAIVTEPLQPAFAAAINAAGVSNFCGDGNEYTFPTTTEIFDQGGDFSSNTFTAPVTGRYQFNFTAEFQALTSVHNQCYMNLVTTARSYIVAYANPYAIGFTSGPNLYCDTFGCSLLVDMTAADTAIFKIYLAGNSKTVNILPGGTHFNGYLVC